MSHWYHSCLVRRRRKNDRSCRCGHEHSAHMHYRAGSECSLCSDCSHFRPTDSLPEQLTRIFRRLRPEATRPVDQNDQSSGGTSHGSLFVPYVTRVREAPPVHDGAGEAEGDLSEIIDGPRTRFVDLGIRPRSCSSSRPCLMAPISRRAAGSSMAAVADLVHRDRHHRGRR
jgi:hypothetical protein